MSIAFSGLLFSSFVPLRQVSLHISQLQDIWHYRSMSEPFLGKRKAQKLTLKRIVIPTCPVRLLSHLGLAYRYVRRQNSDHANMHIPLWG